MSWLIKNAWHLPWRMDDAPHAVLDILRGCNIKCHACYNNSIPKFKSFEEIKSDYEKIMNFRKISTMGIIGGEPLLHPDLIEIIRFLKDRNLSVEVCTNGLLLDEAKCEELARAGTDLIALHIDEGQARSDLPENYSFEDVSNLRTQKAKMIHSYGMEIVMNVTLMNSQMNNLVPLVEYFEKSPYINYFLLTLFRDASNHGKLQGEYPNEIRGEHKLNQCKEEPKIEDVLEILNEELQMKPFAFSTGKIDKAQPRLVTIMSAVSFKGLRPINRHVLRSSDFEKFYIKKYKEKYDRYPFYSKQNCGVNTVQILLNGLFGGDFKGNINFLIKTFNKRKLMKRMLIQQLVQVQEDGRLEHCECCPDMTVHNGKLVPVCACDNFD